MDAFIGEIRAFPYTYTPDGWLTCDGTVYNIQNFQALAAVIGYTYGGSGPTFAVPNLMGRAVVDYTDVSVPNVGGPYTMGQTMGQASVTLGLSQIPSHNHAMVSQSSTSRLTTPSPSAVPFSPQFQGATRTYNLGLYVSATLNPTLVSMAPTALSVAGGGGSHENRSPLLVMRFCICWNGEFPQRN